MLTTTHQLRSLARTALATATLSVVGAATAHAQLPLPGNFPLPGLPGTRPGISPPDKHALPDEITKYSNLRGGVLKIVNYALSFVGLICIIVIIYAGFLYIFDGGQGKNTATAKKMLLYAVIGILFILLSYTIANFIIGIPRASQTAGGGGIGYP